MRSRFLKQFIYGSLYLVVLAGIVYAAYVTLIRPAPSCFDNRQDQGETEVDCGGPNCESCDLKRLEPISVLGSPEILGIMTSQSTLFMKIKNPNQNYGADFSYSVKIYDENDVLVHTVQSDAYIYAAQIKAVADIALPFEARRVARTEVDIANVQWRKAADFSDPALTTRGLKTTVTANQAKVSGLAANSNGYRVGKVGVMAVLYNENGFRVSVSKTTLENITAFEERAFTVNVLFGGKIDPTKTEVYVEARR